PLNALAIHLELLRNSAQTDSPDAQQQKSISALDASVRQVDRLVREFSDYSAPVTMERKATDISEVLATSLEAATAECAPKSISLEKDCAPGPWTIQGDSTRLRKCFDTLLRNAVEAQPEGGTIKVTASKNSNELVLRFADSGPGVPPEQRAEMFEFGKTTKVGGSGIGLPLSQLIVESHGGALGYESERGGAKGGPVPLS